MWFTCHQFKISSNGWAQAAEVKILITHRCSQNPVEVGPRLKPCTIVTSKAKNGP